MFIVCYPLLTDNLSCRALYLFGLAKSYHYFQLKCREPIVTKSGSSVEEAPRQKHEQCGEC